MQRTVFSEKNSGNCRSHQLLVSRAYTKAGTRNGQGQRSLQLRSEYEGSGCQAQRSPTNRDRITQQPIEPPYRTTNRDRKSAPASSTYINTNATLLNAQPPVRCYAPLRTLTTH
ncbi:hypothetical protein CLF_106270 [Clonorchis sinensis]|uniref:Uncharacterized protein n=1 Tax=Clonorchis sinensis TaxID=79923 RepID=G7YPT7_CLOSI|nr:hypothetical protein CLF_106270 [Clonorchis sinensis]